MDSLLTPSPEHNDDSARSDLLERDSLRFWLGVELRYHIRHAFQAGWMFALTYFRAGGQ
jgi:hypothetical protein